MFPPGEIIPYRSISSLVAVCVVCESRLRRAGGAIPGYGRCCHIPDGCGWRGSESGPGLSAVPPPSGQGCVSEPEQWSGEGQGAKAA